MINREIARKGGQRGYSGADAKKRASRRLDRSTRNKIVDTQALRKAVLSLLKTGATPK